jgi:hypothetical protein
MSVESFASTSSTMKSSIFSMNLALHLQVEHPRLIAEHHALRLRSGSAK